MNGTHRGVVWEIEERRWSFALAFFCIFGGVLLFLWSVGATPDVGQRAPAAPAAVSVPVATSTPELPVRVVAKSIGLDVAVENPSSTDTTVLDTSLESGSVRWPTSGLLGESGTVYLFGHSSYLPVVYHQYYKTFDGIQNLKKGEIVSVYSADKEYDYTVTGVKVADATQDVVELPSDGEYLTLSTCDSFADTSTRFVVTATLTSVESLAQ